MSNLPKINRKEKVAKGFDQPTEHLQSEGEILIKNLVQKQTKTNINLNEQLLNKKDFISPQELIQITDFKVGETSLDAFKKTSEHLNQIENLKFYGLTSGEMDFYFNSEKGDDFLKTKYKNLSKDLLDNRLKQINEKINLKKLENNKINLYDKKNVSRHFKEFASSIKPDSQETRLYNFAISNLGQRQDLVPLEHPINNLKDLENELFSHLDREVVPSLVKRRKVMKKLEGTQCSTSHTPEPILKTKSKWDLKDSDLALEIENNIVKNRKSSCNKNSLLGPHLEDCTKNRVYTCEPANFYTIKDGKIIKLHKNSAEKEEEKETGSKTKLLAFKTLTDDEIRLMLKFKNYERGTPYKVLHVKNIAKNGKNEFVNLFNDLNTDSEKPEIKLMTGKMQGQAFLTFKNENLATDALNKYNGYHIKEKPIIISYGKCK